VYRADVGKKFKTQKKLQIYTKKGANEVNKFKTQKKLQIYTKNISPL
jgi:hypothetical protein